MQGEGAKERTRSVLPHTVTKKATPRITPNKASTPPCHAGSGLALVRLSSPLSPDHARIVVHALFVDHAHLMQKPRRFCGARGDGVQCSIPARNDAGATFRILTSPGCVYPPRFCYVLTRTSGAVISVQRAPPGEQIGADAARKKTENRPKMAKTGTFECALARGCMYPRWKSAGH